ncbi:hypothetical protein [Shewanella aestuarii]|uniref:Glycosyltransferase family 9 protein n=1 Tax=Shewanella aestuarii TaxID=1028752 RepID=A0A6G9QIQ5_9GAMM|nr:hypothetical protein [Shewanella aestuarii]QIR13945.1 hypothetical protein HBH39_05065 [Shewanella aestuarii]
MTYRIDSALMPVPNSITNQLNLLAVKYKGQRIAVSPHCELVCNLYLRGHFRDFELVGAIDNNTSKHGKTLSGIPVYGIKELPELDVTSILVIHSHYHQIITSNLVSNVPQNIDVIDLSCKYDDRQFRTQIAQYFDRKNSDMLRPGFESNKAIMAHNLHTAEITIDPCWGLGDKLCLMVAAREFSLRNPHIDVKFNDLKDIVNAFGDDLLSQGQALPLPNNANALHRTKLSSPAANYLGCFLLGLGLDFDQRPKLRLPNVDAPKGLIPGQYIALQPTANFAKPNMTLKDLQAIIDACPLPVVLTGPLQPINSHLANIDQISNQLTHASSDHYGNEMDMLKIIRHAALVITPRSASAHIAAAYQVPAIVCVPNDGENWHLDYPDWICKQIPVTNKLIVKEVIENVNQIISMGNNSNTEIDKEIV